MPISDRNLPPDRVSFVRSLTRAEVDSLVANPELRVLQTAEPAEPATWDLLNERLLRDRPEVELRVYGFYTEGCDLSFLPRLRNVRHFSADCLMHATGVEQIAAFPELESLRLGIYDLEGFDFLAALPAGKLTKLSLGPTKSRKPSLAVIQNFYQLRVLYIEGQQKDIEVIGHLKHLEDLTLRSVTVPSLGFVRSLNRLWSFDMKLGGTTNLSPLESMNGVKYLELWQVTKLADLSVISTMFGLQFLFLQSLRNVRRLPDVSALGCLRRVYLENMKGLEDVDELCNAPALEDFIHVSAQGMEPRQYESLLKLRTLRRALVGFGSDRKNRAFREMIRRAGIEEYRHSAFQFT
jgi:hypothetical protein